MGFSDGDLTTPLHDEIIMWLDARLRSGGLTARVWPELYGEPNWQQSAEIEIAAWRTHAAHSLNDLNAAEGALKASIPIQEVAIRTIWEKPVVAGKGNFIVGYVDLLAQLIQSGDCGTYYNTADGYILRPSLLDSSSRYEVPPKWRTSPCVREKHKALAAFEVKTRIPSLGELLRQMRTYQLHLGNVSLFVVCPDDRFAAPLKEQGIHFLKYEK